MKRYLKKDRIRFETTMNAFFQEIAFRMERAYDDRYYFYLNAIYYVNGVKKPIKYEVRRAEASDGMLSVMGAFISDDSTGTQYKELRAAGYDCNQFTGKWNFHMVDDVDTTISHLKMKFYHLIGEHEKAVEFI